MVSCSPAFFVLYPRPPVAGAADSTAVSGDTLPLRTPGLFCAIFVFWIVILYLEFLAATFLAVTGHGNGFAMTAPPTLFDVGLTAMWTLKVAVANNDLDGCDFVLAHLYRSFCLPLLFSHVSMIHHVSVYVNHQNGQFHSNFVPNEHQTLRKHSANKKPRRLAQAFV